MNRAIARGRGGRAARGSLGRLAARPQKEVRTRSRGWIAPTISGGAVKARLAQSVAIVPGRPVCLGIEHDEAERAGTTSFAERDATGLWGSASGFACAMGFGRCGGRRAVSAVQGADSARAGF
jgi:hypothetical protein